MSESHGYDEGRYVGRQVRIIRARRGISQQVLADRIGVSRGAIAKYENGERPVDSRKVLYALAQALGVTVGDLTGQEQDRLDPCAKGFHAAVPAIELALWTHGNTTPTGDPRTLGELAGLAHQAAELRHACDYASLGPMLAPMLTDCYRHIDGKTEAECERAWDALAAIAFTTAAALKARGYAALAWTAVQEVERAAQNLGGTAAVAAAGFTRSQILLSRPGSLPAALEIAERAAALLEPQVRTRGEVETYGMLHLQSALVSAALGGDPNAHLHEAAEQAARLDHVPAGGSLVRNVTFGPENVGLWRMSVAMERRESGKVLELASELDSESISVQGRRAQYFVEIGRAHALERDYKQSLYALLRAEYAAPQQVRSMNVVRELVGHMMRTARRDLTTGDLGRLAKRVGVAPA
ncbi:helix-turn-helix transcriptional regulator [Nocardia sp. NPDC051030]|uniref:helix-turn-helix domain-containing protein n=1 Tax=Nocardia sp. NPDC051030 TaxID=3155162 RepID=UPI0034438015